MSTRRPLQPKHKPVPSSLHSMTGCSLYSDLTQHTQQDFAKAALSCVELLCIVITGRMLHKALTHRLASIHTGIIPYDRQTDGRTDGRTSRPADRPAYRQTQTDCSQHLHETSCRVFVIMLCFPQLTSFKLSLPISLDGVFPGCCCPRDSHCQSTERLKLSSSHS